MWTEANAAWVQAIGSIVAIFASAGIVLFDHYLTRKREAAAFEKAKNERIAGLHLLLARAGRVVSNVVDWSVPDGAHAGQELASLAHEVHAFQRAFERLDVNAVSHAFVAEAIVSTAAALGRTHAAMTHALDETYQDGTLIYVDQVHETALEVIVTVDGHIRGFDAVRGISDDG